MGAYSLKKRPDKKVINQVYEPDFVDFDTKHDMIRHIQNTISEIFCSSCKSKRIKIKYKIFYRRTKTIKEEKMGGLFGGIASILQKEYFSIIYEDGYVSDYKFKCKSCKNEYGPRHSFLDITTFNIDPGYCAGWLATLPKEEVSQFCKTVLQSNIVNSSFEKLVGNTGSCLWELAFGSHAEKNNTRDQISKAREAWTGFVGIIWVLSRVDMDRAMDSTLGNPFEAY